MAVVILAAGLVVAVAAPIVGGDMFLPKPPWLSVTFSPASGGPTTMPPLSSYTWVQVRSSGAIVVTGRASTTLPAGTAFVGLVASDHRWIAATVALVAVPLWFWWWRRSAMSFARGIGALAAAAAAAALVALTWPAPTFCAGHVLVAAPVAYLAAFLVAPSHREAA